VLEERSLEGVRVTFSDARGIVTAVVLVRWKPSAGSRSLSDISSLTAFARIGVAEATK